jgi:hypothetical protein
MERYIDDWMFKAGIPHDTEPNYPYDPELNTGGLRADWKVDDVFIEAAGMMADKSYAAKMERKRRLASKHDLQLLVITEKDLGALDSIFGDKKYFSLS